MITIEYRGKLYNINKEPNETIEDTYQRGWFIINNLGKYNKDQCYSLSIMMLNIKKGMNY